MQQTLTPRDAIDPSRTLPSVELVPDKALAAGKGSFSVEQHSIISDGISVGKLVLSQDRKGREAWLNGINVHKDVKINGESARGQGFGTAAYLAAIEMAHSEGATFRTHDWSQTEHAVKVWQRFIGAGIGEVVEPFVPYKKGHEQQQQLYSGHVRIPPPQLHA